MFTQAREIIFGASPTEDGGAAGGWLLRRPDDRLIRDIGLSRDQLARALDQWPAARAIAPRTGWGPAGWPLRPPGD